LSQWNRLFKDVENLRENKVAFSMNDRLHKKSVHSAVAGFPSRMERPDDEEDTSANKKV
jgi:hypothetical protein